LSVNLADLHMLYGRLVARPSSGLLRPKQPIPGSDVAGIVEAVGDRATGFKVGDEVFGGCEAPGTEYAIGGKSLVPKPANVSFEQAGAIGVAGLSALQALKKAGVQPDQKLLINGASGGVGTFAVQIAVVGSDRPP
jgi:NADPH:quinone reductase-like Zn-dependent oxidoreductase